MPEEEVIVRFKWECPECGGSLSSSDPKEVKEFRKNHRKEAHDNRSISAAIDFSVYYGDVDITDEFAEAACDIFPYHDGLREVAEEEFYEEGWSAPP